MSAPSVSTRGSGVAKCDLIEKFETLSGYAEIYSASANPGKDWHFVKWEIEDLEGNTKESVNNPYDIWQSYNNTTGPSKYNVKSLIAVFEKDTPPPEYKYTVSVMASPQKAAHVSGSGIYLKDSTCTIGTVKRCSPWVFDHWELIPGGTVYGEYHSFSVTSDTTCIAHYHHTNTGALYYDADGGGEIICGSSGDLLYDGDAV